MGIFYFPGNGKFVKKLGNPEISPKNEMYQIICTFGYF